MRRGRRAAAVRVGWVAAGTLHGSMQSFRTMPRPFPAMRIVNVARWVARNSEAVHTEVYRPDRRYDIVVFTKAMDARCQAEAARIQGAGGRVVFDANVNYYEVWGEYDLPGTKPTEEQQRDAIAMTARADWVVADSTKLLEFVRKVNENASSIPDNVDQRLFRPGSVRRGRGPLTLVWSGMPHKAKPLLMLRDVFRSLDGVELVLVTEETPPELDELSGAIPCRFVPYSERRLAREFRDGDVIISPKRLVNAYELCHTEYKISVGMATGLPAVASPQQSYVEAIGAHGGGAICDTEAEWHMALTRMADRSVRRDLGDRALRTVMERYSTPVVASQFEELFRSLA